jgi:tryptophan 2,3-dioxygenase
MLGLKDPRFLRFHVERSEAHAALLAAMEAPSLYDDALRQLALAGLPVPAEVLNRDVSQTYEPSEGVEAAWLEVYRDTERWWPLYQLAEKLVDLDDALLTWRHKHVVTVERIIGRRQGTGGTDGVGYLVETLKRRCFPELWSLRTKL